MLREKIKTLFMRTAENKPRHYKQTNGKLLYRFMVPALLLLVILISTGIYFLVLSPHPVKVPNIEWETIHKATNILKKKELRLSIKGYFYSESVPKGHVIEQRPKAQAEINTGSTVFVSVSKGFISVSVPDLIGKELKDVGSILSSSNLRIGRINQEAASNLNSNIVVRQQPSAGASSQMGSTVEIWLGPQQYVVPSVKGINLRKAMDLLQRDAFDYKVVWKTDKRFQRETIISQLPEAGSRVPLNSTVYLVVSGPMTRTFIEKKVNRKVVCIDPGHQAHGSSRSEPVGPGSSTTKPEVASGATGIVTKTPEYKINLAIALLLKKELEKSGVKVVMTRSSSEVQLSNVERARIASDAGANLFVRIHCNSSDDKSFHGISTLYPARNSWTKPIFNSSLQAAELVQKSIIREIGSGDLGITPRNDLTGFNWSKVPAILVESGFLSNPLEDKQLNNPAYRAQMASGIAKGVLFFLKT